MNESHLAHLTPTDINGKGKIHLVATSRTGNTRWGKSYTYHRGNSGPEILNAGLYRVEYNLRSGTTDSGFAYTIAFLNEAHRSPPTNTTALGMELSKLTKFAPAILKAMGPVSSIDDAAKKLIDIRFMTSIKGIGIRTATKLIQKIKDTGITDPMHNRLTQIFATYALPTDRVRWQWALRYYREYPDDMDTMRTNPYSLLEIADFDNNRRASKLLRSLKEKKVLKDKVKNLAYTLKDIDPRILDTDERWMYHHHRHMAYLSTYAQKVMVRGSTIVMLRDLFKEMRGSGMSWYTKDLNYPKAQLLEETTLEAMVQESLTLTTVVIEEQTGIEAVGVTFQKVVKWSTLIAGVADRMTSRYKTIFTDSQITAMIKVASDSASVDFTREQMSGIRHAFKARLSAITGPPGTGKTTVSQSLLTALQLYRNEEEVPLLYDIDRSTLRTGYNTYILAPTGVAAQRIRLGLELIDPTTDDPIQLNRISHVEMKEQLELPPKGNHHVQEHIDFGEVYLGTLHSFLGFRSEGNYNLPPLHPCFIFVDEASMIDEEPMYHLMEYVNRCLDEDIECTLLFSGDVNQLPPVGLGFPFRDLLGQGSGAYIPTTKLTVPKRQRGGSQIVEAAISINAGKTPKSAITLFSEGLTASDADFMWIQPTSVQHTEDIHFILNEYKSYLDTHGLAPPGFSDRDIQILVPLRNPSRVEPNALHVNKLNKDLQKYFADQAGHKIQAIPVGIYDKGPAPHKVFFAEGDRVIHTGVNGYRGSLHEPIMRGSIGEVSSIHRGVISVAYSWMDDDVLYEKAKELDQLSLAYAITGHAAQGSEFNHLLMVIPNRGGPTLVDRSWLYTAVTRAKKHLFMVASDHRVRRAVASSDGKDRQTYLSRILAHAT